MNYRHIFSGLFFCFLLSFFSDISAMKNLGMQLVVSAITQGGLRFGEGAMKKVYGPSKDDLISRIKKCEEQLKKFSELNLSDQIKSLEKSINVNHKGLLSQLKRGNSHFEMFNDHEKRMSDLEDFKDEYEYRMKRLRRRVKKLEQNSGDDEEESEEENEDSSMRRIERGSSLTQTLLDKWEKDRSTEEEGE